MVVSGVEIYLSLEDIVDGGVEKERLEKELENLTAQVQRLEALLAGDFAQRAPAQVVETERQKLVTFKESAEKMRRQIESL